LKNLSLERIIIYFFDLFLPKGYLSIFYIFIRIYYEVTLYVSMLGLKEKNRFLPV